MRLSILLVLPLFLSACYMPVKSWLEAADVYRTSESIYEPLPEDTFVKLTTGDLDVTYEEIGVIVVWPPWNRDQRRGIFERINRNLERQARSAPTPSFG